MSEQRMFTRVEYSYYLFCVFCRARVLRPSGFLGSQKRLPIYRDYSQDNIKVDDSQD